MSRNVGQKHPQTPVRSPKRHVCQSSSSSPDLSDDDGYSAVDDISDSEDDDEDDVNAAEEENIMIEASAMPLDAPRPLPSSDDEEARGVHLSEQDGSEKIFKGNFASDAGALRGSSQHRESYFENSDATTQRHVRFDVPYSDSDSTDTEDDHADLFPDIFISQNSLDPAFRREIEHDPDESSGSGSFWDFNSQYEDQLDSETECVAADLSDDGTVTATPIIKQPAPSPPSPVTASEESPDLDGYETDGDTTEEDIPDPPIRRKTRRPSIPSTELSDMADAGPAVKPERGQPRVGRFDLDCSDKKPIAVLNPLTRKMMIFTPHRRRQLDLSPEQFDLSWAMEEQSSPLLSNSANLMLSAMFSSNTFGDLVNSQAIGPAEAFFPFPSESTTADESSTAPSLGGEEDDAEQKLDISDFITWDDEESSAEECENGNWNPSSTPIRPSTASSELDLLSHLNPETVGAFRRNQINQQLILSSQATQDSLAFSGPYNFTALKGLKSDRFATAGVPLTPIRRQKKNQTDMVRSPLESLSAKRKASAAEVGVGHKRQRSISDVNMLRI